MTFLSSKPADELRFEDEAEDPMALGGLGMSIKNDANDADDEDDGEEDAEAAGVAVPPLEEEEELDDLRRLERLEREVKLEEPEIDLGENDDGDLM